MIVRDNVSKILIGGKSTLLINPPIYDTQYWAYWSQPHGLLKVATWLRSQGYKHEHIRLIDCLATDSKRQVRYQVRDKVERDNIVKIRRHFGMSMAELRTHLTEHADGTRFRPDEIWITSIMTYWWESTRDVIKAIKEIFGEATPRILVGGIYPTLYADHANTKLREGIDIEDEKL